MDEEKKEDLNTESLSVVTIIGFFLLLAILAVFLWVPIATNPIFIFSTSFAVILATKLLFSKKYHRPINYVFSALIAVIIFLVVLIFTDRILFIISH